MTAYDDARARLPKDVVALCDETIAEHRKYWALRKAGEVKGHEHHKSKAAYAAMEKALQRVGVGTQESRSRPMSSLTSEQRGVITILSEDEIPIGPLTPVRGGARMRRRTLGIDPPGILEQLVGERTRWELHDSLPVHSEEDPSTDLPDAQRIEVLVEGILGEYPGRYFKQLERALDSHGKYAGAYAARTLSSLGHESAHQLYWVGAALFTVLARSGRRFPRRRTGCSPSPPTCSSPSRPRG